MPNSTPARTVPGPVPGRVAATVPAPVSRIPAAITLFSLAFLGLLLFRFSPTQYAFYPQCPIQLVFGIQCPGCGTTRAIAALLHGDLRQALHLNALTVCSIPVLAVGAAFRTLPSLLDRPLPPQRVTPAAIYIGCAIIVVFTIARNV